MTQVTAVMVQRMADEIKRLVRASGCPNFDNAEFVAEGVLDVMKDATPGMIDAAYDRGEMCPEDTWQLMIEVAKEGGKVE